MKQNLVIGAIITIILFGVSLFLTPYVIVFWALLTTEPFLETTPDELFDKYVLDGDFRKPPDFSILEGLEATAFFVPQQGPVYMYLRTEDDFVTQLIQREAQYWEPYAEVSCVSFFEVVHNFGEIQRHPDKFEWWHPTSVVSPICYQSKHKSPVYDDESKYLLIDNNNEIYFFRTITPRTLDGH